MSYHSDAVYRAGGEAQFTSRAVFRDNRMELFCAAYDRVHGAGVDTFYTTYAGFFVDYGYQGFRNGRATMLMRLA